jgi:hypothetical protein
LQAHHFSQDKPQAGLPQETTLASHSALREPQIVSGPDGLQLEQLVQIMNEQNEAFMENYRQIAQKEAEMVPPGISDRW